MFSRTDPSSAPRPSLALRLTLWYATSAFILVVACAGFLYWALFTSYEREDDEALRDKIHLARALFLVHSDDFEKTNRVMGWENGKDSSGPFFYRVMDGNGQKIFESSRLRSELSASEFPPPSPIGQEPSFGVTVHAKSGRTYRLVSARVQLGPSEGETFLVQVALDRSTEQDLISRYRERLWAAILGSLALSSLVGFFIARRGIAPVRKIAAAARKTTLTTLDQRLNPQDFPSEFSELASTFNGMLNRLEESFSRISRFSDDIAHELRTPLNSLRGQVEVALRKERTSLEYQETLETCLEEYERMTSMIESLLFMSRAENTASAFASEKFDVGREIASTLEFYEAVANESGISVKVKNENEKLHLCGDRALFRRALGNLLENAISHTANGGTLDVEVERNADTIQVTVSDTGCGIAESHLPHIFDRFYRVDPSRSGAFGGAGLGLSIVKTIMTMHGGIVQVRSQVGKGTGVTLHFPSESKPSLSPPIERSKGYEKVT